MAGFLLDANVFIEAWKGYYAPDIVPGFWISLIKHAEDGSLFSIDRVLAELERGRDALCDLAKEQFGPFWRSTTDVEVVAAYKETINLVYANSDYLETAKHDFAEADNADAWIVAYAKAKGCTVITDERFNENIKRRIPIPNVCRKVDVKCLNTFGMLRRLNTIF